MTELNNRINEKIKEITKYVEELEVIMFILSNKLHKHLNKT